jgi:biotin carboxyl carrier protein
MSTRVRITVDGRGHEAEMRRNEEGILEVEIEGEVFPIEDRGPATGARGQTIIVNGHTHEVERIDLERVRVDDAVSTYRIEEVRSGKAGAQVPHSGLDVRPPMPGRIVRVTVAEGETVDEGGLIAVLEAMKMQNEVTSPATGTVRRVLVQEGDTVDAQQVILQLGPLEEETSPKKEVVA